MPTTNLKVRTATLSDAAEISRLSAELGYPTPVEDVPARLTTLLSLSAHCIAVAELDGSVVGGSRRNAGCRWTIAVRSNAARVESHAFYEGLGFSRTKAQHAYVKHLPSS